MSLCGTEWRERGYGLSAFCVACQKAKIHTHIPPQPVHIPIPERCFSHIHVGLVYRTTSTFTRIKTHFHHCGQNHAGQKQCHSQQPLPQPVQRHFVLHGSAHLAFLTPSHLSRALSSLFHYDHNSLPSCTIPTSPPSIP